MKNNSNIYDIDGELLRSIDDTHKLTIEEAQKRVDSYSKKLKELDEKDPKYAVYGTYIRNLTRYILEQYAKMPADQLNAELAKIKAQKSLDEQVKDAIETLKKDIDDTETGENTENEVQGTTAGDNESSTNGESGNVETVERELSDVHEERTTTQSDLLVERDDVNNNMDEYVQFEELPGEV